MNDLHLPKDKIVSGDLLEAVHLATWRLNKRQSDPNFHLDLFIALCELAPSRIPVELPLHLLKYFSSTANFSSSFATLFYLGKIENQPTDKEIDVFLNTFGPGGESGSSVAPPKLNREDDNDLDDPPIGSVDEDEVINHAITVWDNAKNQLFILPPMRGHKVPLFQAMNKNSLKLLINNGKLRYLGRDDNIIKQGEVDSSFYILLNGVLEVAREESDSKIRLGFLRSGSFFGEMALVTDGPRNATIKANECSIVLEIQWDLLNSMLEKSPELANELARYTRFRLLKNLMATSPLFRTLPKVAKGHVIKTFKPVIPDMNSKVISEGSPSPGLFLIASGEVEVFTEKDGTKTLLSTLGPGSVFGEISLIREGPATASIGVNEDGVVLMHLKREDFQDLAVLYPELLSHVYQVSIDRVETNKKLKSEEAIPAEDLLL